MFMTLVRFWLDDVVNVYDFTSREAYYFSFAQLLKFFVKLGRLSSCADWCNPAVLREG